MSDRSNVSREADIALYDLADKTLTDLSYTAPEDVAMKRTKLYLALLRAFHAGRDSAGGR